MDKEQFIEEYKKLLLSCKYEESRVFCREHIRTVVGDKLYKYTSITPYSIENLWKNQLYLNNPRSFNDPFDCWLPKTQTHSRYSNSMENRYADLAKEVPAEKRQEFRAYMENIKKSNENDLYADFNNFIDKKTRVVCLSKQPPTETIMWGYYGNSHKGICLEYDFSRCEDAFCDMIKPIDYVDTPPIIACEPNIATNGYYECMTLLSTLSKSKKWDKEEEWRLINFFKKESNTGYSASVPYLKHIYIGVYADKTKCRYKKIIKFAKKNGIPVSKMEREDNIYSLKPNLITG